MTVTATPRSRSRSPQRRVMGETPDQTYGSCTPVKMLHHPPDGEIRQRGRIAGGDAVGNARHVHRFAQDAVQQRTADLASRAACQAARSCT